MVAGAGWVEADLGADVADVRAGKVEMGSVNWATTKTGDTFEPQEFR
jgi:hypothetical protein